MAVENPDVIIIGAGAGGAATAWRLVSQGLNVLILEAGGRFDPQTDYKLDQPDWERHAFPEKKNSQGAVSIAELGLLKPGYSDLQSWSRTRGKLAREGKRKASGPGYWHVQGVGGSTLHYVGEAHRLNPASMRLKTEFGVGCDWPIDYAELEPYYLEVEKLIGVAGPAEQGERWRSAPFPLPAHPLSTSAEALVQAGQQLGMQWQANSRAALSQPYDNRPPCNYCGNCSKGCPISDKGSADVTFIRHAEASGRLTIKTHSPVVGLELSENGQIAAVRFIEQGQKQRLSATSVVLAAGAVQTPAILLNASQPGAEQGLANGSSQVGKNFMETLVWNSTGIVSDLSNTHMGLPADAICWDFNRPDAIDGVVGGCRLTSATREIGFTGPIAYATRAVGGFGRKMKQQMRQSFGKALSVGAIGEFLPNADSYVDLDHSNKNSLGLYSPQIHSSLGQQELARLRFMAEKSRALLKQAGAELVEEFTTYDHFSATHVFGTCRMGTDPLNSVVNAYGQSHDHANLFITDASVFPSTGGGEAPSLTIQALALRTADYIVSLKTT